LKKSAIPMEERPAHVQHWFQTWSALGWFCRTENKEPGPNSAAAAAREAKVSRDEQRNKSNPATL
jgi:hypothetical protein